MPKRQFLKTVEPRKRLVVFDDGEQVFIEDNPIMQVQIQRSDAIVVDDFVVIGETDELELVKEQAKTNSVDIDTIKPTMNEQKTDNKQEIKDVDL